jgi:hypothetical protein
MTSRVTVLVVVAVLLAAPVPSAPQTRATDTDNETAIELLNRVETLLTRAVADKDPKRDIVGTSGSKGGSLKVVVDRADIDEMRAEIAQIKLLLQGKQKP